MLLIACGQRCAVVNLISIICRHGDLTLMHGQFTGKTGDFIVSRHRISISILDHHAGFVDLVVNFTRIGQTAGIGDGGDLVTVHKSKAFAGVDRQVLLLHKGKSVIGLFRICRNQCDRARSDSQGAVAVRDNITFSHVLVVLVTLTVFGNDSDNDLIGYGRRVDLRDLRGDHQGVSRQKTFPITKLGIASDPRGQRSGIIDLFITLGHHRNGTGIHRQRSFHTVDLIVCSLIHVIGIKDPNIFKHVISSTHTRDRTYSGRNHIMPKHSALIESLNDTVSLLCEWRTVVSLLRIIRHNGNGTLAHGQRAVLASNVIVKGNIVILLIVYHNGKAVFHSVSSGRLGLCSICERGNMGIACKRARGDLIAFAGNRSSVIRFFSRARGKGDETLGKRQRAVLVADLIVCRYVCAVSTKQLRLTCVLHRDFRCVGISLKAKQTRQIAHHQALSLGNAISAHNGI